MKILEIIPSLELGGAEKVVQHLSLALHAQGHAVTVVSLYSQESVISQTLRAAGIDVLFLDKQPGLDVRSVLSLRQLIQALRPEVIHSHLYALNYVMAATVGLGRQNIVHTVHSVAGEESGPLYRRLYKAYFRHRGVVPVAISALVKTSILQEYALEETAVPLIFNGISLQNVPAKTSYALNDGFQVLHVGSFKPAKNHRLLIEAFAECLHAVPEAKLHLLGDGPLRAEIQNLVQAKGMGEAVQFHGQVDEVYPLMQKADLFVLPSAWEGMPVSVLEAMAMGLPILVTDVGGISDMITHQKNGWLVEASASAIAQKILELRLSEETRRALGSQAKADARRFSAEAMGANYLALFQRNAHDAK